MHVVSPRRSLRPDEVDDTRIVAMWPESHPAAELDLARAPDRAKLERFVTAAGAEGAVAA